MIKCILRDAGYEFCQKVVFELKWKSEGTIDSDDEE
jgi:hypothetical protein